MQLVEQLQAKRTEAHNHLVSRKRKLSELFAATVCTGDLFNTTANQQYFQQLQAFHDANDLQKNRFFKESTLPPRPQILRLPRNESVKPINGDALHPTEGLEPAKSPVRPEPVAASAESTSELKDQNLISTSENTQDVVPTDLTPTDIPKSTSEDATTSDQPSVPTVESSILPADSSLIHAKPPSPPLQAEPKSKTPVDTLEKDHKDGAPASSTLPNNLDVQSSPASTNRPGSNTPDPTAGSPTTSPGDEDVTLNLHNTSQEKKPEDATSRSRPTTPQTEKLHPAHKVSISSTDIDMMDTDLNAAFDSPQQTFDSSAQIRRDSSNRKPPIRINTETGQNRPPVLTGSTIVETPAPITAAETPRNISFSTPVSAVDTTKRATRISSGALQKKSVSEILGETPKPISPHADSPVSTSTRDAFASSSAQGRQLDRDRKEKERTKMSTVVFAKPQRLSDVDTIDITGNSNHDAEKTNPEDRDYLYTLFESKAYSSKQGNLSHLIQHSHKTITTTDHLVDYEYQAQCRVLKRLYQLQSADRWALRQRKRADEPPRRTSHWDFLLDHAKWMRTDFREERKWKYAAARDLAERCAQWVASSPEERKRLQVQVRIPGPTTKQDQTDTAMSDEPGPAVSSHPTPELVASGEDESVSDDIADPRDISLSNAPAAIFSLGAGDFNFVADKTAAFDKLINELPLYEPARIEPDLSKSNLAEKLDARWKTDIVPVSRFATEKLVVKDQKAPVRRSRYDYEIESSPVGKSEILPPREENVGLFMPDNKHIRDRIHPGHSFRPPSEHPMPTQAFFETRSSSQWTPAEDDELRRLVKDYSYNWSLISSCLTPRSLYSSSPDRRTPWECFERWIGLEGMPADMAKTPYFRTYSGRIEAAGRHVQAQLEEAQRRAGPSAQIPNRKRTTQPVRVERKRASRHLAMLDAMRKLAKKREVHRQKQTHSAEMAAMRKSNEVNQPRLGAKTPAEWSQLKHEREQKLAKQQELYRQQLIAHQRAATAQQQRGPNSAGNAAPNGMPQNANAARGPPNGVAGPAMPNGQMAVPNGVPRPHPAMMGVPNGMSVPNGMGGPKGMPAQMQANMRNGMGSSPQQMRMLSEAQKMHQEQMMRQAQQNGSQTSPNSVNANMANGANLNNPAFLAAMAHANGAPSPSANMNGTSNSPRNAGMGQALSSGHVPVLAQMAATIKERHPNLSDEEVQRHATQQLTNWQQQATAAAAGQAQRPRVNQAALNAAMGAANAAANAGMAAAAANGAFAGISNEQIQQYNQRVRMQQAQQHAARGMQSQMQPGMMSQMNNSPVMNMARPVSQHNNQGMSRSATPRDQRSGSVSNMSATSASNININGGSTPVSNGQAQGQNQQGPQSSPRVKPSQSLQT